MSLSKVMMTLAWLTSMNLLLAEETSLLEQATVLEDTLSAGTSDGSTIIDGWFKTLLRTKGATNP